MQQNQGTFDPFQMHCKNMKAVEYSQKVGADPLQSGLRAALVKLSLVLGFTHL